MPINVAEDRWYRPLYQAVYEGLVSRGLKHIDIPGPSIAVRGPGNASDVPLESFYLSLNGDLVLLLQVRGVIKTGSLLFSIGNFLGHFGLTRILREYSRAGDAFPVAPILRDPLNWPQLKEERILCGGNSWISKNTGAAELAHFGTLWVEAISDRLVPRLRLLTERDLFERVLAERQLSARKVACYLYLGEFALARAGALQLYEKYDKYKLSHPVSSADRAQFMSVCDEEFLNRVLESCDADRLILRAVAP